MPIKPVLFIHLPGRFSGALGLSTAFLQAPCLGQKSSDTEDTRGPAKGCVLASPLIQGIDCPHTRLLTSAMDKTLCKYCGLMMAAKIHGNEKRSGGWKGAQHARARSELCWPRCPRHRAGCPDRIPGKGRLKCPGACGTACPASVA